MTKIIVDIQSCQECSFFYTDKQYSTDGFDFMENWNCRKKDKKIQGAVEWHEISKIKIPDWCPIKFEVYPIKFKSD